MTGAYRQQPADKITASISVVIPTRNRPTELQRALKSVGAQSQLDFEVIVVDDASDETYDLPIQDFPNIHHIFLAKQSGPAVARNTGVTAASGQWVTFLDDDDEWEPKFVEEMLTTLGSYSGKKVFAWPGFLNVEYSTDGKPYKSEARNFFEVYENREKLISDALTIGAGCGLTVDRNCFNSIGGFRTEYSLLEDTDLLFRLLVEGCEPIAVPEILLRIHHNHTIDRLTDISLYPVRIKEFRHLLSVYDAFLESYPSIKKWMWEYCSFLEEKYAEFEAEPYVP